MELNVNSIVVGHEVVNSWHLGELMGEGPLAQGMPH